jgi:hypothetical protein
MTVKDDDIAASVRSDLWRHAYTRLFAHALYEQNPQARQAYINAIATIIELRRARKERYAARR